MKMSTRNVTPRANEEGEIGVVGKVWKALRAKIIEATSKMTAPTVEASDKSKNVATTEFVKNRENMVVSPFLLQRNTAYKIGNMVKVPKLGEQYVLECTQAGTTAATEPNLSTVTGEVEVNDGSAKFRVVDRRLKAMIDMLYPVGIVVTTATDDAKKPGEAEGLAIWEEIASGRGLIGAGTGTDANKESVSFTAGNTGGEYKHKLTVNELPEHAHAENINGKGNDDWDNKFGSMVSRPNPGTGNTAGYSVDISSNWNTTGHPVMTDETGENQAHNNMQPYLVVHFWKRIK
jgi:hypothetical protein